MLKKKALLLAAVALLLLTAGCALIGEFMDDALVDATRFLVGCESSSNGTFEGFTCNGKGLAAWILAQLALHADAPFGLTASQSGEVDCSQVRAREYQDYLTQKVQAPDLWGPHGLPVARTVFECGRQVRRGDTTAGWLVEQRGDDLCIAAGGLCWSEVDRFYRKPTIEVKAVGEFQWPGDCPPFERRSPLYCRAAQLAQAAHSVFVRELMWSHNPIGNGPRGAIRAAHLSFHRSHPGQRETGAAARVHLEEVAAVLLLAGSENGERFDAPQELSAKGRGCWWSLDAWARRRGLAQDFTSYVKSKPGE